ncbi:hypothetical protein L1887_50341 [Cichorium endivia]|nr:hypothetical protein L1887_50341 [Cichorium endivia]
MCSDELAGMGGERLFLGLGQSGGGGCRFERRRDALLDAQHEALVRWTAGGRQRSAVVARGVICASAGPAVLGSLGTLALSLALGRLAPPI